MQRLHGRKGRHAMLFAPGQEFGHSAAVGAARVRVADGGGEELEEPSLRLVGGGDNEHRQTVGRRHLGARGG